MPIFMDLHKLPVGGAPPTKEQLFEVHSRDLKLQSKYGIKYMVYIANLKARHVFCIIDAPDFKSCVAIHQEAHAEGACHLIEVKGGDFVDFIGDPTNIDQFDMLQITKGVPDTGYRTIMATEYISLTKNDPFMNKLRSLISETKEAKLIRNTEKEMLVFRDTQNAIEFAKTIMIEHQKIRPGHNNELRIGIAAGEPVNENSNSIYGVAINKATCLCGFLKKEGIIICSLAGKLMDRSPDEIKNSSFNLKILSSGEESFLMQLDEAIQMLEDDPFFNTRFLAKKLSMSQSVFYRKLNSITNASIVQLLQEKRLRNSYSKLKEHNDNISQIAYDCGFKSPSYFTRCFKKRFGIPPAQVANLNSAANE